MAVLLSLLTVTVAKPYYANEGEFLESRSFFEDDESVIQGEAHFQYMNEAKENMNLKFADEMQDSVALSENYGEIKEDTAEKQTPFVINCNEGEAIINVNRVTQRRGWRVTCQPVSTFLSISR